MTFSAKALALSTLGGLIVGAVLGYIPAHQQTTSLADSNTTLSQNKQDLQQQLSKTQARLRVSQLTAQAGSAYADVEQNNFSVAANQTSSLFTDLRTLDSQTSDPQLKTGINDILSTRDSTIAALAQANPAVKDRLLQIFEKMQTLNTPSI